MLYLRRNPRVVLGWLLLSAMVYGILWLIRNITGWESFPVGFGVAVLFAGGLYVSPKIYSAQHEESGEAAADRTAAGRGDDIPTD